MAVVYKQKENQDQPQVSGTTDSSNSGSIAAGQGSAPGVSAPTSSGRFTNLNNYIQANTAYNTSGGGVAGQVASNLQNQGKSLEAGLNADQQDFGKQAESARVQYNPDFVQSTVQNASEAVKDPNNLSQWNKQLSGQYSGPKDLSNSAQLRNQAQDYKTQADQSTSEGGRFNLLASTFNNPAYSSGQQQLDNLFLQSSPGQQNVLQGARSNAITSGNKLDQAGIEAAQQAQNYGQEAQATNKATQGALQSGYDAFNTDLNKQVSDAQNSDAAQNAQYQNYLTQLQNRSIDPTLAQQLGLTSNERVYNVPLQDYLALNSGSGATRNNVANSDQANQLAALTQLGGNAVPLTNDLNPDLAGTYQEASINSNASGLAAAIQSAQDRYNNQVIYHNGDSLPGTAVASNQPIKAMSDMNIQDLIKFTNDQQNNANNGDWGPNYGREGERPSDKAQAQAKAVQQLVSNYQNQNGFNNLINYLNGSSGSKPAQAPIT